MVRIIEHFVYIFQKLKYILVRVIVFFTFIRGNFLQAIYSTSWFLNSGFPTELKLNEHGQMARETF